MCIFYKSRGMKFSLPLPFFFSLSLSLYKYVYLYIYIYIDIVTFARQQMKRNLAISPAKMARLRMTWGDSDHE